MIHNKNRVGGMRQGSFHPLLLLCLVCVSVNTLAFQPSAPAVPIRRAKSSIRRHPWAQSPDLTLFSSSSNDDKHDDASSFASALNGDDLKKSRFQKLKSLVRVCTSPIKSVFCKRNLSALKFSLAVMSSFWVMTSPRISQTTAHASAPVMALPKTEARDPVTEAMANHERKMTAKAQEDLQEFNRQAREIEKAKGPAAREQFQIEYKAKQQQIADEKVKGLEQLKRDLLDQGICPFTDMEGQRQVLLFEKGLDLAEVQGTQFNLEKELEEKNPKKSMAFKMQNNRKMIQCMVQDMKNRDIDPLEYFEKHKDKTEGILDLAPGVAARIAQDYETNLEKYGQITVPKEGEMSTLEKMKAKKDSEDPKAAKAAAKKKAAEEKALEKAKLKEEKQKAKEAAAAAKEQAQKEKTAAAAAATAAAATAAAASAAATSAASAVAGESFQAGTQATTSTQQEETSSSSNEVQPSTETSDDGTSSTALSSSSSAPSTSTPVISQSKLSMLKIPAVVVAVGGGGYAVKIFKDKKDAEEKERQEALRLMFGGDSDDSTDDDNQDGIDLSSLTFDQEKSLEDTSKPEPVKEKAAPEKKRLKGIKNVFSKKNKANRETDLSVLVDSSNENAKAPEFAKLLAKILTFGAPGRFPSVVNLPGDMPMEKFDLEEAKNQLVESRLSFDLTVEESAEIFANVVNCMLIDIVDLASYTLKEKDDKATVKAINIVVDFMNHAASLYDAVAEGAVITPVIYCGDLSKAKLEQMYSAYAISGMMDMANLDESFDSRVGLLQDVFNINEKKAEGLMMKAMQKNMMKMLKSGEGMEGMEEMLKSMGGGDMAGLEGLMGGEDGEGPNPEQLKEMLLALKEMKDSGAIPDSELETVKKQFKDSFGSSIDDIIKESDAEKGAMGTDDKELLDLMKSILGD